MSKVTDIVNGAAANTGFVPYKLEGVIDPVQWRGKPVPDRRWIVQDWIPHGAVTMLGGDGGLGKSLLAQQLMTASATGERWLGLEVQPVKVFGVFCEDDDDELHRRQENINRLMNVGYGDLENMKMVSRVGEDSALVDYVVDQDAGFGAKPKLETTDLFRSIRKAAMDFGAQILVLDSLHDLFSGNENSRPEVRRFTQFLIGLALDIDGAVVLTSHPSLSGMSSGSGLSGNTAWNNAVRSRLYMTSPETDGEEDDQDVRLLSRKKANYARRDDSIRMKWKDGVFVSLEPDTGFVGGLDRAAKGRRCKEVFLKLLDLRENEGRPVSHKPRSANYAPKEFSKRSDREGYTRRDFDRAMDELFTSSAIATAKYGDAPSRMFDKIERVSQ